MFLASGKRKYWHFLGLAKNNEKAPSRVWGCPNHNKDNNKDNNSGNRTALYRACRYLLGSP